MAARAVRAATAAVVVVRAVRLARALQGLALTAVQALPAALLRLRTVHSSTLRMDQAAALMLVLAAVAVPLAQALLRKALLEDRAV
jgi:hypothetical protein